MDLCWYCNVYEQYCIGDSMGRPYHAIFTFVGGHYSPLISILSAIFSISRVHTRKHGFLRFCILM